MGNVCFGVSGRHLEARCVLLQPQISYRLSDRAEDKSELAIQVKKQRCRVSRICQYQHVKEIKSAYIHPDG